MNKFIKIIAIPAMIFVFGFGFVNAQSEEITLKFSRDFGFSGAGKIQGLFSMKVTSSVQLSEVEFFIDNESLGKDALEPFSFQFNTDNYSPGDHSLYAIGYTITGNALKTREELAHFISAEDSKKATLNLIVPILGLSLIVVIVSAVVPGIMTKKRGSVAPGTERNYGAAGGTICSRCSRPFLRHVFAPNMLFGKLERCPHCGKWGIFRAHPIDALRKAEKAELSSVTDQVLSNPSSSGEEKLHDELDSTKYQDL